MKTYSTNELAARIDHATLKPDLTEENVRSDAELCMELGVASMCVRPCDVALAASLLKDSAVKTSCVLSFPHGDDTTAAKAFQARQAIMDGVEEIDMVMNIGQFLSGKHDAVRDDIKAVVDICHAENVLLKVIQESCYLTLDEVAVACELSLQAGADFVKTSTGFGPSSASPEIIAVMVRTVGGKMGIKASGGIRTREQAVNYLNQGATRLGVGATRSLLAGGTAEGNY
jgi:deoxyribose-phosphate aldolase